MKKKNYFVTAGFSIAAAFAGTCSMAQTVDNNFARDRSVAVSERAKADYTPLGLRLGAFAVQPSVGVSIGANDNVFYEDVDKQSDTYLALTPSVEATSQWSRHLLAVGVQVNSVGYGDNGSENSTDWDLHARGRFDISSRMNVFGNLSHLEGTESRANPLSPIDAAEPVKTTNDAVALGFTVVGNRLRFIGTTTSSDLSYEDVPSIVAGVIINQHARDVTTTTVSGRVDYALSPNVSVFVNAEGNKREYQTTGLDSSGSIFGFGTSFDLDKLARGEIQIGSLSQDYDSATLGKQTSFYYNGKVEYFPTQLTTLTLTVDRAYSESVTFGADSVLTSSGSIAVDHELLRNLILSALASYATYDFNGIDRNDKRTALRLGAQYFMNPRMSLNASYRYEKLASDGSATYRNYSDNIFQIGILFKY